jgi:hypothetical protein
MATGTTTTRPRHDDDQHDQDGHDADEQHGQAPPQPQRNPGQQGRSDEHHDDGNSGSGKAGAPGQLKKQR